ncbi:AsmA family protein [Hymenobacter sp. BT175]|uniref:AsmA family protein n=1 Tax=Hymenobacter translucens TaxID=2886507 RepID=UPI001D0E7DF5|nr:AsmA family protein [Hymenobacter translucens]MCC2546588.1 AsmA family protein [Hymenobacter translucens]
MKLRSLRRTLLIGALLIGFVIGLLAWLIGSTLGQRYLEQLVRTRLTRNTELVLAPFDVRLSPWRDFPHLTASIHHLSLTDTAYGQRVPVLRIGRADMRLELGGLLRGQVRITRLVVHDVDFREQVDAQGHSWGLNGKRPRPRPARDPILNLDLDSLLVYNFRMQTRNDYTQRAFGASCRLARLAATIRGGQLRARGTLDGQLDYLRNSGGAILEREPIRAVVNYRYSFQERKGTFSRCRATLNGDTIRIRGTHTSVPDQRGTLLNLRFAGNQPLTDVLRTALPESMRPFVEGATSPSKARIRYTISGLSGPTVSPHGVLRFGLRGASLQWPDSSRRIHHWDVQGIYDNGPAHNALTTSLTLRQCRIYSSAGRLDIDLMLRDFTRPFVSGRVRGRTELPELAAVVLPGRWKARHGIAEMDLHLHGLVPTTLKTNLIPAHWRRRKEENRGRKGISVRGNLTLRNASFVLTSRNASVSELNVQVGLEDSIWRLSNASGVIDRMRFRATATTENLLTYVTDQYPSTRITGNFAVDELHVARLRELLQPRPSPLRTRVRRHPRVRGAALAASMGSSLIPPGVHLNIGLRCQRLVLPADTLNNLAATVLHDGKRVQLRNLAGQVWGGQISGQAAWPTDPANRVAPIDFNLGVRFNTINYRRFLTLLTRPPKRPAKQPGSPALRELVLAADGQVTCDIHTVELPGGENLRNLRLRLLKNGPAMHLPLLTFTTTRGGRGTATASARVVGRNVEAADASLDLRYATLDVQQLLQLLAGLSPDEEEEMPPDRMLKRAVRRERRERENGSVLTNGVLRALLRVQADQVQYAAIKGQNFRLLSHLRDGEAHLDECSLKAFQGQVKLRGLMLINVGHYRHPLHIQTQLQDIQLPDLFDAATAMGLNGFSGENIRGSMRCAADLHLVLDSTFLPMADQTLGYLKTDIRDLELLNVEALEQALRFMKGTRTSHLFFEPVSSRFVLSGRQLMIPGLRLNSNLTNLEICGNYYLDGQANLFVGVNPLQALFGNNEKRVERIQNEERRRPFAPGLTYVNVLRPTARTRYKVRFFQKMEQQRQQDKLRLDYQQLLGQRLDTTMSLLR